MCSFSFSGSLFSASGTRLPCALFLAGVQFSRLPRVLVCFLVVFDLLFAFVVLSCRILDSAFQFILYVHEHDRLARLGMLTVQTAVSDGICRISSSRDRKDQSYPIEQCLESVEEYSKSEPEPRNGNVNTVYSLIRPGEIFESVARSLFTMRNEHAIANVYLYLNFLLRKCS